MGTTTLERPNDTGPGVVGERRFTSVLAVYAASRVLTLLGVTVGGFFRPDLSPERFLAAWDGGWYLALIRDGYPQAVPEVAGQAAKSTLAFFPLFPAAARGIAWLLPVSDAVAALMVSLLAGAAAAVLVFLLAERLAGRAAAHRTVALFCFFPGSVVLSMVYSEALTVALAAGCLLALVDRRWLTAGVAAALATACRPNAIALVLACGWQAAMAIRERREWRSLIAPALAPVGILMFFGFLWLRTGELDAWLRVEHEGWNQQFAFGEPVLHAVAHFLRYPFADPEPLIVLLGSAFVVVSARLLFGSAGPRRSLSTR